MADHDFKILIADDEATSRHLLASYLTKWGHQIITCDDGQQAMNALLGPNPPRLALLDWNMPGFSGVEVCKEISKRESLNFIYTIIITAKSGSDDIVSALQSGAHDFITKPFDQNVLKSRISVGLRLINEKLVLDDVNSLIKEYATQMETLAQERAKQLVHADRMVTLGIMSAGIAHEINNPTSFISGNIQTIARFWADLQPLLRNMGDTADQEKLAFIFEEMPKSIDGIRSGVSRISTIVKGLKSYSHKDKSETHETNIHGCIEQSLELTQGMIRNKVDLTLALSPDIPVVMGAASKIEQVFVNLIINACHATANKEERKLAISTEINTNQVQIHIDDNGPGVPDNIKENIWNPFFTTKPVGQGTGLGLSISQGIIAEHGGQITVSTAPLGGARFTVSLPLHLAQQRLQQQ